MTRAAIYARYSTEEQDPRSIEDQIRRCTEHASKHGYHVVATYQDAAVSGAHTDRQELQQLLKLARNPSPPFHAVLVDDLSRLARSIGDTWRIIDDLAAYGVKVIDVQTGMASDEPNARSMFGMKSVFNDHFLQIVRYQTHRGLQGRAMAGFSAGGSIYGYRTTPEANASNPEHPRKVRTIYEPEAEIVRAIFAAYDEGAGSYRAIADDLNRRGVLAPRDGRRGHKVGRGWNHTTVRAVLINPSYIGTFTWNASKWERVPGKRGRRRRARPVSDRVVREYPELAIVDRATWERVQERIGRTHHLDRSGTRRGRPAGSGPRAYLVSGLLRCGVCGGAYSIAGQRTKAGVRYATFGCSTHRSRGASICSNSLTISERKITAALLDALRAALSAPGIQDAFDAEVERLTQQRASLPKPAQLERALHAAERRLANATRLLVELPDDPDVRRERDLAKTEAERLTSLIASHAATPPALPGQRMLRASVSRLLDRICAEEPGRAREELARVMRPLVLAPKTNNPGHLQATGAVSLRAVLANCCSGGAPLPVATLPVPLDFRA